ncbi:MAG: RNA polymerase sigma factor [candidate division Zixibacteria bacterium]|nr:RNA polymerase sigma factor [candidate division Zixibacteria bacterium]
MGNRDEGDDLYQESLVSALTSFTSLREDKYFRSWLYRIVMNRFKNLKRNKWWKRLVPLTPLIEETIGGENPVTKYRAKERLEVAFRVLKPEDKVLVTLYEIEGWKLSELSELTGSSVGSIKVRLSRAKMKMRERLCRKLNKISMLVDKRNFRDGEMVCIVTKPGKK